MNNGYSQDFSKMNDSDFLKVLREFILVNSYLLITSYENSNFVNFYRLKKRFKLTKWKELITLLDLEKEYEDFKNFKAATLKDRFLAKKSVRKAPIDLNLIKQKEYFILITTLDDFKHDIELDLSLIGLSEKSSKRLSGLKKGDVIIYYLSSLKCFVGISEIDGDYYYDNKNKIWTDDFYLRPARRKTKKKLLCKDLSQAVYIKPLLDDLLFIRNKEKWGTNFHGRFKTIPKNDFLLIQKIMKKNLKKNS
ncbi:MAG: EVE domain-containing protein [Cetobacterium sp.]